MYMIINSAVNCCRWVDIEGVSWIEPVTPPRFFSTVAQLGVHPPCKRDAAGSSPARGAKKIDR